MIFSRPAVLFCIMFLLLNIGFGQAVKENTIQWSAKELWPQSTSRGVQLDKELIVLNDQQLIEDDAPGFGFDSNPAANEVLKQGVVIKKILVIDRLPVKEAYITALLYPENPPIPNNGRHVVFSVNGHEVKYEVKHFWTNAKIPVSVLRKGENEITMRTLEPDTRFRTWLSLDENFAKGSTKRTSSPGRSARSSDGGKTWNGTSIGELGTVKGEYPIRLKLVAYGYEGWIESTVIDLLQENQTVPISAIAIISNVTISAEIRRPAGTGSTLYYRSGSHPTPNDIGWTQWAEVKGKIDGKMMKGRYLQVRMILKSDNPLRTPSIQSLRIVTSITNSDLDLKKAYKVTSLRHYPVRKSSFPFIYENPQHPRLKDLRTKFKLDSVVIGAKTEFEKILQLKSWVARQWQWHLLQPDEDIFEWDAEKILTPDSSGKIYGGFCLHYAIVMMQVLQSFGLQSRIVSADYSIWSGHEICEVWSNEFGKWIMLDANFDTYFVDSSTGIPLNTLELHDLFVQAFYPHSMIDRDNWSREKLVRRANETAHTIPVIGMVGGGANSNSLKSYEWWNPIVDQTPYCGGYGPLTMGFIRLLPRANFLSQQAPTPINHGRTHWGWTGYYNWYDTHTPRAQEHEIFTNRRNDIYWNINQVGMHFTPSANGLLTIDLETNSPDFDHYEVEWNNSVYETKESALTVQSERGINRFEVRIVDSMGNKGMKSNVEYIFLPVHEQSVPRITR